HFLGRVRWDVTLLSQPSEAPPHRHERPIHRRYCLVLLPSQGITKVGYVSGRHSSHDKRFPVGTAEPTCEFADVLGEGSAAVAGEVVGVQKGGEQSTFLSANGDEAENIIARIVTAFWTEIRHDVDTPAGQVGGYWFLSPNVIS